MKVPANTITEKEKRKWAFIYLYVIIAYNYLVFTVHSHTHMLTKILQKIWQEFTISVRFLDTSMMFHKNTSIQSVVGISVFNHGEDKRL